MGFPDTSFIGRPPAERRDRREEENMSDVVFLLLSVVLFYLSIRYTRWADRV